MTPRNRARDKRLTRKKRYYEAKVRSGVCLHCPRIAAPYRRCFACRVREAARVQEYYQRRRQEAR